MMTLSNAAPAWVGPVVAKLPGEPDVPIYCELPVESASVIQSRQLHVGRTGKLVVITIRCLQISAFL